MTRKGSSQRPRLSLTLAVVPQPGMYGTTVASNPRDFMTGQPVPALAAVASSNRAERRGWEGETDRDMTVSVFLRFDLLRVILARAHEIMVNLSTIER